MRTIIGVLAFVWASGVHAAPPIEAYGDLPAFRSMALSPAGDRVAYLLRKDGEEYLTVYTFGEGLSGGARVNEMKAGQVEFAGPRYVIIRGSETTGMYGVRGRFEFSAAIAYSLETGKAVQLLSKTDILYPAQSGLGRIVGILEEEDEVLMPAFTGKSSKPQHDLLHVRLDNGRGKVYASGYNRTMDWVVGADGTILAREDYNNDTDKYEIFTKQGGETRKIYEETSSRPPLSVVGAKLDQSALLVIDDNEYGDFANMRELSFDGRFSLPIFQRSDAEVNDVILDMNRVVYGVGYSGLIPRYDFFDTKLTAAVQAFQAYFKEDAAYLVSWSEDFSRLLFKVEGSTAPGDYYLYQPGKRLANFITSSRPEIPPEDIGRVLTIEYKARDGLTIPAILTLPTNGQTQSLPLIVLPHGGPAAYDAIGFDWMAQFFASRGYLVFQPNFRGSAGFGATFETAGKGEWGGKMQDDITDGVQSLIGSGRADPARICIVGGSYGGYAALAGGAFTPDLYKCVAAIAPVSDLPHMLDFERSEHGANHWVLDYWQDVIGDRREDREKLERISPVNHAADFMAPVLLIHGKDDLTVPIAQSERMERALKSAGKEVEFVRLKGEDHYLSKSETRLDTLKALDAFVSKHIGAR